MQINNWNEESKANTEELLLLVEMKYNLESDLKDCIWNVEKNENLWRSNSIVLNYLEQQSVFHDSLRAHFGNILGTTTQRRNMSAYDNLKSKGIDLIKNERLRRNITILYSERYYYIEMKELEYDNKIQMSQGILEVFGCFALCQKVLADVSENLNHVKSIHPIIAASFLFASTKEQSESLRFDFYN